MPDPNTSQPFPPEDVLLRFKPPEMPETERLIQGVAQEYMVVRNPKANSGIYPLGRFCGDKWESPRTDRPIVAELLRQNSSLRIEYERTAKMVADHAIEANKQLAAKDALLADAMKNAERLGKEIMDLHKMCQAREDQLAARDEALAAAVAAERKRCREKEVEPLRKELHAAMRAIGLPEMSFGEERIQKIQESLP